VEAPAPAHPERLRSTGNRADRAKIQGQTAHAWQVGTVQDAGGRGVCTKLSRFVHTQT
jgi:hypothetical protein